MLHSYMDIQEQREYYATHFQTVDLRYFLKQLDKENKKETVELRDIIRAEVKKRERRSRWDNVKQKAQEYETEN